jgi:hypothetical protein
VPVRVKITGSHVAVEISDTVTLNYYSYYVARNLIMIAGLSMERLYFYELFATIQKIGLNS